MKRVWNWIGWLAFWLTWPLIHVSIRIHKRTRILVTYKDQALVVMDWLGPGTWSLPGGGMHANEQPVAGALRELREETNITLDAEQLSYHGEHTVTNDQKHKYTYHLFTVALKTKPQVRRQNYELREIAWLSKDELLRDKRTSSVTRGVVKGWWPK